MPEILDLNQYPEDHERPPINPDHVLELASSTNPILQSFGLGTIGVLVTGLIFLGRAIDL